MNARHAIPFVFALFPALLASAGPSLTWSEIQKQYQCPDWFRDAKFGIWSHWGAQSQPREGGGWYASHMYYQRGAPEWGARAYPYHLENYGHPSEVGYKEVFNSWKAEKFDADALVAYFKETGARYFVALAVHHDRVDNFDSTHHGWNSVNFGPKRDIIGEYAAAARKVGLPFGVSSHDDRMFEFYAGAFRSDATGPKAGVHYDGRLTRKDGVGKWWEGMDPSDLYGPPPEQRDEKWIEEMKRKWVLRHNELIDRYKPVLLWYDGYGFPYGEAGKQSALHFYNEDPRPNGVFQNVVVGKIANDPAVLADIERGGSGTLLAKPWQGTSTFTSWFYKEDLPCKHNSRTLVEMLVDIVSKNGCFLLSVEMRGDGTIPREHKVHLDAMGKWLALNGEAIYGSRPWQVFGDNLSGRRQALAGEAIGAAATVTHHGDHYNERTVASPPYPHDEVRFTSRGGILYLFVLNPREGSIRIPSLGLKSPQRPGAISSISLIGSDAVIQYDQSDDGLDLTVPGDRPDAHTAVFAVRGVIQAP